MSASLAFGWRALLADEYAQLGKHIAGGATFCEVNRAAATNRPEFTSRGVYQSKHLEQVT